VTEEVKVTSGAGKDQGQGVVTAVAEGMEVDS
jgi:hypothetical protein